MYIGDSNTVLCTCDDGQLKRVDFKSLEELSSPRVSDSGLLCIEPLGGNYYAIGTVDGSLSSYNAAHNVVNQTIQAHLDSIKKMVALQEKVRKNQ